MYVLMAMVGLVVLFVGLALLHEWFTNWLYQRKKARLPVVEDKCPLCGYQRFNAYGVQVCPGCGAEVNVKSFLCRCISCGYDRIGYGPSVCPQCGAELWVGTTVKYYPGASQTWEYQAQHDPEFAAMMREAYAEARSVSTNGVA